MSRAYDVIVVGGGIAGLTSAAYLSRAGLRTLLVEKRRKTGGLVETFQHQGFAFDAGIRAFENSGILFPMLKDLGIELEYVKNQVFIGLQDQVVKLSNKASLEDYMTMLRSLFPAEARDLAAIQREIEKVMGYMDVLYGIDNPLFLQEMNLQYLRKTLLPWFLKYQVNIRKASRLDEPIVKHLSRFTKNQALIDMITQHFFQETPAFFALSYFSLYLDYGYPLGGTGVLVEKMTEYIRQAGGEILTECAAKTLDASRHRLELENGEAFHYQDLVWAADQSTLYDLCKGIDSVDFLNQQRLTSTSRGNDSILTLFVGLDESPDYLRQRCGAHMFYTAQPKGLSSLPLWKETLKESEADLFPWISQYLERTTFELSCPVLRDARLAPAGKSGLIISTLMDYRLVRHLAEAGQYQRFKNFASETILRVLNNSLLPGIREKTLFAFCATPLTLERETQNKEGAITGWSFSNPVLPAKQRFKEISQAVRTPIPDVYQCGQWTFSPSGLPVSIITGKLAADAVIKKQKKKALKP